MSDITGDRETESVESLLRDLEKAASVAPKHREEKIIRTAERLGSRAYEEGLSKDHIDQIVDLITTPNELDQASTVCLIKNLYPSGKVSVDSTLKVIGALGHGQTRATFSTQAWLLRWLVMVYDVLEDPKVLSQAYSVLFNLLDTIAIRQPLCHLLSLITRRKHVRPFRIHLLLELARKVGNEPALVGLIRVYKDYYPDVIIGDLAAGRASVFTHPNPEWKERLAQIQEMEAQRSRNDTNGHLDSFRVVRRGISGVKRSRVSVVPEVHTSHAQESSVTLEEIEDVQAFVNNLEKVKLPNQLVAVMGDPLLQKLLQLKSTDKTRQRVENWLLAFFEDQLQNDEGSEAVVLDMLSSVLDYTRFTKTVPDACLKYLKSLLDDWNGIAGREVVLELLSYTPLTPWEDLHQSILEPLEQAILDDSLASQNDLLTLVTSLLRNWATFLLTQPEPAFASSSIESFCKYGNTLALAILENESEGSLSSSTILSFYECNAAMLSRPELRQIVRITTPPGELVYSLNIDDSLSTVSRLCSVLAIYKQAFEVAQSKPTSPTSSSPRDTKDTKYHKDYVNHFNGFLMDICNLIWRSRAFNTQDTNALGCLMPGPLVQTLSNYISSLDAGVGLMSLFSLSYSPVLCSLTIGLIRDLEEKDAADGVLETRHAGPVTQKSLVALGREGGIQLTWPQYRLGVLKYLEDKGVNGIGELMYNTMKHLIAQRKDAARV